MPGLSDDFEQQLKVARRQLVPSDEAPNGYVLTVVNRHPFKFAWRHPAERQVIEGAGDPNGDRNATKGTLYTDRDAPALWINTDGLSAWELVGSAPAAPARALLFGHAGNQTPMGIGDGAQALLWDTIYTHDPLTDLSTETDLPAALGLVVGGGSLPTTFLEATETGVWLVALSVYIAASATEAVALAIFGDTTSPVSPELPLLDGGITKSGIQAVGFTWVPSLSPGDGLSAALVREDDSNAYDGAADVYMRIVRLA